MKITFERIDFAKGTVTEREREIETSQVLAGNALFQQLARKRSPAPCELCGQDGDCA